MTSSIHEFGRDNSIFERVQLLPQWTELIHRYFNRLLHWNASFRANSIWDNLATKPRLMQKHGFGSRQAEILIWPYNLWVFVCICICTSNTISRTIIVVLCHYSGWIVTNRWRIPWKCTQHAPIVGLYLSASTPLKHQTQSKCHIVYNEWKLDNRMVRIGEKIRWISLLYRLSTNLTLVAYCLCYNQKLCYRKKSIDNSVFSHRLRIFQREKRVSYTKLWIPLFVPKINMKS